MHRTLTLLFAAAALTGCGPPRRDPSPNPLAALPIDSARVPAVDETASWAYRRQTSADLDGDGGAETIVLASDVTLGPDGEALWEDGHRWAVYVEPNGEPLLLYSAFVPNGFAESAVTAADDRGRRKIFIQERTPTRVRVMDIDYSAGEGRLASDAYYQIEQWLPGAAAMP